MPIWNLYIILLHLIKERTIWLSPTALSIFSAFWSAATAHYSNSWAQFHLHATLSACSALWSAATAQRAAVNWPIIGIWNMFYLKRLHSMHSLYLRHGRLRALYALVTFYGQRQCTLLLPQHLPPAYVYVYRWPCRIPARTWMHAQFSI